MSVRFSIGSWFIFAILLFRLTPFWGAQSNETSEELTFKRRIVWSGGENAWRYEMEIERAEGGTYRPI